MKDSHNSRMLQRVALPPPPNIAPVGRNFKGDPVSTGVAQNQSPRAKRRFWSWVPFAKVPLWYMFLSHSQLRASFFV